MDLTTTVETVINSYPDALLAVSNEGTILIANEQAAALFGYTVEELTGAFIDLLLPRRFRSIHPTERKLYFEDPKARPMGSGLELYGLKKDGTEFPVDISLKPVVNSKVFPDSPLVLASIRDVSQIRAMQQDLDDAKKSLSALHVLQYNSNKLLWLVIGSVVGQIVVFIILQIQLRLHQ